LTSTRPESINSFLQFGTPYIKYSVQPQIPDFPVSQSPVFPQIDPIFTVSRNRVRCIWFVKWLISKVIAFLLNLVLKRQAIQRKGKAEHSGEEDLLRYRTQRLFQCSWWAGDVFHVLTKLIFIRFTKSMSGATFRRGMHKPATWINLN
jgi:hypothetical protein